MTEATTPYVKLESRLVLLAWLNEQFGFSNNREMLAAMKAAEEGYDAGGHSFLYHKLISLGSKVRLAPETLARYDDNIRNHVQAINAQRVEPIRLRYFQHLAAFYTEIILDLIHNQSAGFLKSLNDFVAARNQAKVAGEPEDAPFTERDLRKMAFWMATGSGKTLILHLNYHQYLHYNSEPLDNLLLITPNEGLSEQHLAELAASGIPARRFDLNHNSLLAGGKNVVQVIEITKLVEEKRGGGVSVPVEAFEGRNLIFVDEGHKGSGGDTWRKYRDALGETGFTFEYSATFGQALTASRNDALTTEYGKAIAFDYSYRYFHGDGYGKDFRVLNLQKDTTDDQAGTLMMGNLLSFYQQLRIYEDQAGALRPYLIERPLWVFVGSTVNAVYSEKSEKRSDVLTVARFLHRVLANKKDWSVKTLRKLLEGKSGLKSADGMDVFAGRFDYLQSLGHTAEETYRDILKSVMHTSEAGGLHLCEMRGSPGEIGLKAGGADRYFGLIYIGDTNAFKKLVEEDDAGITLEEDVINGSLFEGINRPDISLNLMIGAKKFIEGWNSWRVSAMGLLNIGKQEGSQIIQLFGRGVRLRGKGHSLKRSAMLAGEHPQHIRLLETLNIFAVRANYMNAFRDYLEKEGVETEEAIELPLFVYARQELMGKGLVIPRVPDDQSFSQFETLILESDDRVHAHVDLTLKVQSIESMGMAVAVGAVSAGQAESNLSAEQLDLVNWEQVYLDLIDHKKRKGFPNLVIPPDAPRHIFDYRTSKGLSLYQLRADEFLLNPSSFAGARRLQAAVTSILRSYMDDFYRIRREHWESNHMVYRRLDEHDPNLSFNHQNLKEGDGSYIVRVKRSDKALIDAITKLIKDKKKLMDEASGEPARIAFDRHLYAPLLIHSTKIASSTPPPLEKSAEIFVRDIKTYWDDEKSRSLAGCEVYLLRNLSRGSGVGFFEDRGFYPDFMLWIVKGDAQRLVFIEPHGMIYEKPYSENTKLQLHANIPAMAEEIGKNSKISNVTLDAFIISATSYADLHKRFDDGSWDKPRFAEKHILFQEPRTITYDYIAQLFAGT
jgi:hypothetical protein